MSDHNDAPLGFIVDPALPVEDARSLAFNYMDAVERSLAEVAAAESDGENTVGGNSAVLWSLSYVAAMAKALVQHDSLRRRKPAAQ